MIERRIQAIAQLSAVSRCGPARLNALFDDLVATGIDLEDLPECGPRVLLEKLHFTPGQANEFIEAAGPARRMTERLRTGHLSVITRLDRGWPPRLRRQFSGSVVPWLFVVGEPSLLCSRSIGIGGSRDATARSLELTRELSLRLAERGVVIVSGGARGVDGAAHRAALSAGGKTIVVLAQGIGTFQIPDRWREWIERGSLTIVSEFAPMDEWESFRALQRNTTVGRLGEAFLVVQAGLKSGTLSAG